MIVVQELDFLVYSELDCIDCSPLVLWFLSINLDVDVIQLQFFNFAHLVKPYCYVCF